MMNAQFFSLGTILKATMRDTEVVVITTRAVPNERLFVEGRFLRELIATENNQ